MVCKNCGNELRDDARFCPHCGASAMPAPGGQPPQEADAPQAPAWEGPEGNGGKKKAGLMIGIAVAAVAVVALLVFVLGGLFSNSKKQVEAAFVKSAAAYKAAEEKLGLPDTAQWQKDQTVSQRMSLELKIINSALVVMDLSALSGLGLGMRADYDGKGRTMGMELSAWWGEDELLAFQMAAEDDELYFNSPQLTGQTHYGVNTETMGADLAARGVTDMKDVSFNLFDLVDMALERFDQEKLERDFKQANKALWEQAKVKKTGAKTLSVNGTETKTAAYQVIIPQEALEQYVDSLETVLSAINYYDLYEEMFQAIGMPRDEIEDFLNELEDLDVYSELADSLRDAIDELGDVELEVCLSGGYISAVQYEGQVDGSSFSVGICLGGNEEYVDDISIDIASEDLSVEIKSTGDHGLKRGAYTDETTVRVRDGRSTLARATSELALDPGKDSDNFQWKLGVDSSGMSIFVLEASGDYQTTDDYLSLSLEDASLRVVGMEVCNLAFDYYMDCHPSTTALTDFQIITQMSEDELEQMVLDTQKRTLQWASDMESLFLARLPQELLWGMAGRF